MLNSTSAERAHMSVHELTETMVQIRASLQELETRYTEQLQRVHPDNLASAQNLIHYIGLRSRDLRQIQEDLTAVGLSSLGRMEAGVLGHLDLVITALECLAGEVRSTRPAEQRLTPAQGRTLLSEHANDLLGPARPDRQTRIMVTMPSEAAQSPELVKHMCRAGMDLARINCAHDDQQAWAKMVTNLQDSAADDASIPRIAMDLAGPKLRTGPLQPGEKVRKTRPRRSSTGDVLEPAFVVLSSEPDPAPFDGFDGVDLHVVPIEESAILTTAPLQVGEKLRYTDARGSSRSLIVEASSPTSVLVSTTKTIYWHTGSLIYDTDQNPLFTIADLPALEQALRVHEGDTLVLTKDMEPQPVTDTAPFTIGCSLPEIFAQVRKGERVWFDDGKIGADVFAVTQDSIELTVTHTGPKGSKLRAEKGINFPDTDVHVLALTEEDLQHLDFVASHADIVNMSFVSTTDDISQLIAELQNRNASGVDIVLKIETVAAFRALPELLLEAMRWPRVGVMIARGDLAVEAGFERMAELQEEILWLCEAAHVPVIWATQVLESMAKSGLPSRSEITDAAMAQRAEAVMLNKGPFIAETISTLHDILARMDGHTSKKRDMLRALESWRVRDSEPKET
ncbi:pyruvate kinase [Micrococcoides hystricis]|uniref:pyruvate kinase n=1 Tax=Micrococcoides hystricis TaxID=1572761 RepID=A0ABV6P6P1_9MICC